MGDWVPRSLVRSGLSSRHSTGPSKLDNTLKTRAEQGAPRGHKVGWRMYGCKCIYHIEEDLKSTGQTIANGHQRHLIYYLMRPPFTVLFYFFF